MIRRHRSLLAGGVSGLAAVAAVAVAAEVDSRGWTTGGEVAAEAKVVLEGVDEHPVIDLPKSLYQRLDGPTLLFYFSPTCPHCRSVAREVDALHDRLVASGQASVLGIATGSSTEAAVAEFGATYEVGFPVVIDTERDMAASLAVRSTPSAMLVVPGPGRKVRAIDLWYPYFPGFDAYVEARLADDVWSVFRPGEYLGNNWCGTCHLQEHQSWRLTHHSVAWKTLVDAERTTDPACVSCHVTGAGEASGWAPGDPDSILVDVGCESCHGPGGPHDGTTTDAKASCAQCHDEKHSIAFSVDKGMPHIDHFAAVGLDEDAMRERRLALYSGDAPRELLAFPEGENVGSRACLDCHAAEHAWWSEDAHANAMASLRDEGGDDPACVRCHATAKRSGLPPDTLAGYRTLEGVGCESCHGPGEAHVAAGGGADNIEGLGDDCPVCVIEAVCTGCHTSKWSPDWQLEPRLQAITHGSDSPPAPSGSER